MFEFLIGFVVGVPLAFFGFYCIVYFVITPIYGVLVARDAVARAVQSNGYKDGYTGMGGFVTNLIMLSFMAFVLVVAYQTLRDTAVGHLIDQILGL